MHAVAAHQREERHDRPEHRPIAVIATLLTNVARPLHDWAQPAPPPRRCTARITYYGAESARRAAVPARAKSQA